MPALLRIFTRVNLVAFVGEEQGIKFSKYASCMAPTEFIIHGSADQLKVYDDVMSFFWSCAKAFPILNLLPGFLLPSVMPFDHQKRAFHQSDECTESSVL